MEELIERNEGKSLAKARRRVCVYLSVMVQMMVLMLMKRGRQMPFCRPSAGGGGAVGGGPEMKDAVCPTAAAGASVETGVVHHSAASKRGAVAGVEKAGDAAEVHAERRMMNAALAFLLQAINGGESE